MSQNETSGTVAVDNQKIRTKQMVLIALMTAVTCVLGPLSIPLPFSPVPISLTNFAIFLAIFVLGMKSGTISFIIYLLLGAVGVPVFSSFRGRARSSENLWKNLENVNMRTAWILTGQQDVLAD